MEKNKTLDIARGVAIIMVMVGHCIFYNTADSSETLVFNVIWSLQMPIFFLVSGYVTRYSSHEICHIRDYGNYLIRRSVSYLLPWVIWTLFVKCLLVNRDIYMVSYLKNMINSMDSGYWFLFTLWSICLLYGTAVFLANQITKHPFMNTIWLCVFTAIEAIIVFFIGRIAGMQFLGIKYTLYYLIFFYLGMFIGRISDNTDLPIRRIAQIAFLPLLALYLLIICNFNLYATRDSGMNILIRMTASMLGGAVLFIYLSSEDMKKTGNFLALFGRYSLELYLIHYLFLSRIKLDYIPALMTVDGIILSTVNFIIMIVFSSLVIKILSSNKWSRYILFAKG